jgi:hypothetical protein
MDANTISLHFDLPRNILICNLGQQFAGWVASPEPLHFADLRFRIDGEEIEPVLVRREDVEQAMPACQCTGWHFMLDRRSTWHRAARTMIVEAVMGAQVVAKRAFWKSRALLQPERNGPLYFMHIPKTAGTALRHIVDYVFADLPSLLVYGDAPGVDLAEALMLPESFLASREIVFGHFDFNFTRALTGDVAPKIVTSLRHPSELVRSYLTFTSEPDAKVLDNPLVRHFSGIGYLEPFGGITDEHFQIALHHALEHCFIVPQEHLQLFADDLATLFDLPPYCLDRVNESPNEQNGLRAPHPVDLRFDTELYAACRGRTRSFVDFLNA